MSRPLLRIEKAVFGGYGLAFYNGMAVFVEKAIPGDLVYVDIYAKKKNHAFARIDGIASHSNDRIEAPCSAFYECGGCCYLCLSYEDEIKHKSDIVRELLKHIGGMNDIPQIDIITGERFYYRSHAKVKTNGSLCGFFKKNSNELVPFPDAGCLLLSQELMSLVKPALKTKELYVSTGAPGFEPSVAGLLIEKEFGIIYERGERNFFQANRFLRSSLLERVAEYASLSKEENFIDIGCGVGFFTLYLASAAAFGKGVDINKESIAMAKKNAVLNKIDNVAFDAIPAAAINPHRQKYDAAILDPPRAGLDKKSRRTISAINAERMVYVSCSPPTFARDAADFIKAGYVLDRLTLIDMFPCTQHIELIGRFLYEQKHSVLS